MAAQHQGPLVSMARRVGGAWWVLLLTGIAWIVVGFVVLRFDNSTVYVVSIVFGVMLLLAAAGEILRAWITIGGWRIWHIVFAVLLLAAAIFSFANPVGTFASLALVVGFYFVFVGLYDTISSFFGIGVYPGWWLQLISGIAELILGMLASSSASSSVIVLVTYVSITAIFRGISEIAASFGIRQVAQVVTA